MSNTGFAMIPVWMWRDETIPAHAKLVFVTLTCFVGASDTAWPSHATIAKQSGISPASVKRALLWLRANGHLTWVNRVDGNGKTSNEYTILARPGGQPDPHP